MAFLTKGCKRDLQIVAMELGATDVTDLKVFELKKAIMESENYEEDFVKGFLNQVVEERKRREEVEEKIRVEECEEKKRKEQMEWDEKKRKEQMEFEFQKLKLENERKCNEETRGFSGKPKIELHSIIQKFNPRSNDIGLYLVLFERQARRAEIKKELWVSYLIGLLPYEVAQVIAREEETEDYDVVKALLLKRYKLTPERFRQLFREHYKKPEVTWCDFVYELKCYFLEWIRGLKIETLEDLSDLIITDQIKHKCSEEIRDNFIHEWLQFKKPEEMADKFDEFEDVKSSIVRKPKDYTVKEHSSLYAKRSDWEMENRNETNLNEHKSLFPPFRDSSRESTERELTFPQPKGSKECGCFTHYAKNCTERHSKPHEGGDEKKGRDVVTAKINFEFLKDKTLKVPKSPLTYADLLVNNKDVKTLIDSGSEICILNSNVVPSRKNGKEKIILTSAFGEKIEAYLTKIQISAKNENNRKLIYPIEIIVAVTDKITEQFIIPSNIYDLLLESTAYFQNADTSLSGSFSAERKQDVWRIFSKEKNKPMRTLSSQLESGGGDVFIKNFNKSIDKETRQFLNVYIKNFTDDLDDDKLRELFQKYGKITSAKIMTDDIGKSKGFGFVSFEEPENAEKAVNDLNGKELNGKTLYVGRAQKKSERAAELERRFKLMKIQRMSGYQGVNLYIKNLDDAVDDERLRKEFASFGTIISTKIMTDVNGRSRGFGFVCFSSPEEATKAVSEMNGRIVVTKPLYVSKARRKEDHKAHWASQYAAYGSNANTGWPNVQSRLVY